MNHASVNVSRLFAGGLLVAVLSSAEPSVALASTPMGPLPPGAYPAAMPASNQLPPYAGTPNYGYPAQSFRWGWFGAEHYSAPTRWHRGYYGNHYRWHGRSAY